MISKSNALCVTALTRAPCRMILVPFKNDLSQTS
ncbi:hypothetical protein AHF37_03830 [Paragonimus kellicotti]|nr:hypothetical protein AHF37_03830 [Paragonimus kellicotti]